MHQCAKALQHCWQSLQRRWLSTRLRRGLALVALLTAMTVAGKVCRGAYCCAPAGTTAVGIVLLPRSVLKARFLLLLQLRRTSL